ncbi:hypothetical protein OIO90_000052 [Microbotryomycetes sp. JL221]|nr:hypothetical protein OIO90_000052 [Microbotryomycetes sp. JL221]
MSANSYSALLRRSKLASFTPSIEQVYTPGSAAQLSRENFGFKHPVPAATTSKAPYIRVTNLDNAQRRTEYRKATREATYVRKWAELNVALKPSKANSYNQSTFQSTELQSRFVPQGMPGSIQTVSEAKQAAEAARRVPNFFAMTAHDFERFLDSLGQQREQFRQFAASSIAGETGPSDIEGFDLYEHAQADPAHVTRLVEQFLAQQYNAKDRSVDKITPYTHKTLGLQYSTPTQIETDLAPPVPGRNLGPRASRPGSKQDSHVALIMGQIEESRGGYPTTFQPDAAGHRTNEAGRGMFVLAPEVNAERFAMDVNTPGWFGQPLRDSVPAHEPAALASQLVELKPVWVDNAKQKPLPGTMAYSGEPARRSSVSTEPNSLVSFLKQSRSSALLSRTGGYPQGKTYAEKEQQRKTANALRQQRLDDDTWADTTVKTRKRKGSSAAAIIDGLNSMLQPKGDGGAGKQLKAKAKAAATAAKKRAAEQAAQQARQEQAEQQAATMPTASAGRFSTSSLSARRAANVTQYWVDHQSGTLAPNGGGLLRIGYDQAAFERGMFEVVYEPKTQQEWAKEVERRRKQARGETEDDGTNPEAAELNEAREDGEIKAIGNEAQVQQPQVTVNKEHLAYILKQLEVPDREAKAALRRHDNDLAKALSDLTAPSEPVPRSGVEPSRLVKA